MHKALLRALKLLSPAERNRAILLLGIMVIGMALEVAGVGLVIPVVALLTQQNPIESYPALKTALDYFGQPDQETLIVGALLALLGVYLIKNVYLGIMVWRQTQFSFNLQAELSQRLFTIYLRQPYTFHLQRNSAHLIRNVQSEVNIFTAYVVLPAMHLVAESMVLLGLCALLVIVEPLGTLVVMMVLGIAAWGFSKTSKKHTSRWGQARQYHDGMRMQQLHQGLGGAKDVKLMGREGDFLNQYRIHNIESARVNQYQSTMQQLPRLWLEVLGVAGLVTLVLIMLFQGREIATILPTLGLFAAAAFRLMPSVNRMLGSVQSLRYGMPVIDTLNEELNLDVPVILKKVSSNISEFQNNIILDGVAFTYSGSRDPAIKNISIMINKGESIGLVGKSGSGKSTLVDIVLGLLLPDSGVVAIDGHDIHENLRAWQDQIGYVPQSIYLTDDSFRRNVAFGLPDDQIDNVAVKRAVQAAQLEKFVSSLPDGIETIVGERGIRLSGGQRQRIGIARALYHDPNVLVLDEATSALDTATENGVMHAVMALQGEKTIIIVAHRLSTVEHCDRLYRLEQGKVIEQGAPSEIIPVIKAT